MSHAFCKSGEELAIEWFKLFLAAQGNGVGIQQKFVERHRVVVEAELCSRFPGQRFVFNSLGAVCVGEKDVSFQLYKKAALAIPLVSDAGAAVRAGTATALETFVYYYAPFTGDTAGFSESLTGLIQYVRSLP